MAARADWAVRYRDLPVLVLGASGFIGGRVAKALEHAGARLTRVTRGDATGVTGTVVAADLSLPGEIEKVVADTDPALVFNLAGYGVDPHERDEQMAQRLNCDLVKRLASSLAPCGEGWPGQRVVHVGSALEYGEASGDLDEESEERATTVYGRSKLAGTRALAGVCRERGLRGVTARLFMIYGPGEHSGRLLPSLMDAAQQGLSLDLTAGEQRRDFTYVDDVAEGLLRLGVSTGPLGQVVNLATGRLTRVRDFAACAGRLLGMREEQLRFGALPTRGHEMQHDPVAISRLRQRLGWSPCVSVETGLRRTLDERSQKRQEDS